LQRPERSGTRSLRARIVELVEEYATPLGFTPGLRLEGLVDTHVPAAVGENIVAVVRESLSNVARHAHAGRADVAVLVESDEVTVSITDDGVGLPADGHRSGLANLQVRASGLGGRFNAVTSPRGGTQICWQVPLPD
jgi:signal transduction histidine kinase